VCTVAIRREGEDKVGGRMEKLKLKRKGKKGVGFTFTRKFKK
jgi:hypothetical protein